MAALLPPIISVSLHTLSVVVYNSDTPLLLAWVVDPRMRDMYIDYSSFIPKYFPINLFLLLLNYSKTPLNITSIASMGTGFPYLYWNIDTLLIPLIPRENITNTTKFSNLYP